MKDIDALQQMHGGTAHDIRLRASRVEQKHAYGGIVGFAGKILRPILRFGGKPPLRESGTF